MDSEERERLEKEIQQTLQQGLLDNAAEQAIKGYGPEILGYLSALTKDEDEASEVFSEFCEDLWRGLASFRHQSSFRTWAYQLACNARRKHARRSVRRRERRLETGEISALVQIVRTSTLVHFKTEVKDRFVQLRDGLSSLERELLILRIDRQMSWEELAQVLHPDLDLRPESLDRKTSALRQRFKRTKEKLRELAKREGILEV